MTTFTATDGKVYPRDLLLQQVDVWRAQGRKIVLTNGCFDLLHAGHISTLESARSYGNVLIVGINSDTSVQRLKGPGRPLNYENDRARVIAALACVDAVTVFCEETADVLLELIRPEVYVKGGDYEKPEKVPEWPTVQRYGGQVIVTPLVDGHSTTRLIASARG